MKRIISLFVALCMMFMLTSTAFAKTEQKDYPYIFVHGMMGYGENTEGQYEEPYWGMSSDVNILEYFRGNGYEAYAPSVGGLSSAWDRACELYAQLAGTVVDYGAYHSAKYGHSRYGRDYTDRPIMGRHWDLKEKINLVTHSFGGPTATILCSLLAYGNADEIAACDDCSELFKGGHADAVYSLSTLVSPHNGSPVSNLLYDTKIPVYLVATYVNIMGMSKNPSIDFMLDQYGISADPSTGKTASFNPIGIIKLASSNDNCSYDMSIQGAKDLMQYKLPESLYCFSYACDTTTTNEKGKVTVETDDSLTPTAKLVVLLAGKKIGGIQLSDDWAHNDGLVPVPSALYPQNAESNHIFYEDGMKIKSGVWYVMPVQEGNHGYHVAGSMEKLAGFYDSLTGLINSL